MEDEMIITQNIMSKGDRYENLSPKKHLNVIRPYLKDLIIEHKPTVELNDNDNKNNNHDNNNNNNNNNNNDNNRAEQKIQFRKQINFISRSFKDKHTMHPKSEPV